MHSVQRWDERNGALYVLLWSVESTKEFKKFYCSSVILLGFQWYQKGMECFQRVKHDGPKEIECKASDFRFFTQSEEYSSFLLTQHQHNWESRVQEYERNTKTLLHGVMWTLNLRHLEQNAFFFVLKMIDRVSNVLNNLKLFHIQTDLNSNKSKFLVTTATITLSVMKYQ